MGLIAPLFLAGLAALSLPLVLHLIRRTPRGRQAFSSLMFLTPSPPRLTRRSRLDNLLLLLLRLAALALLAFAFTRPFLREAAALRLQDLNRRRVAIVLDTSASMRRGDLWQQAQREAEQVLADLGPADDVALFTCGDHLRTVVNFEDEQAEHRQNKPELVRNQLRALQPTWEATDLGAALVAVASELEVASDVGASPAQPHLVLISDLQQGARLAALQAYTWPAKLRLEARVLTVREPSNASLQLLLDEAAVETAEPRVRIANAADSTADQFYLHWSAGSADGKVARSEQESIATYVPAGQSRVVRLPRPAGRLRADRIVLRGDNCDFDNTFYVVPPRQQELQLAYFGNDATDDEKGLLYFLRLALADDPLRKVTITPHASPPAALATAPAGPQIVVVSQAVPAAFVKELDRFVVAGGTLLAVPRDRDAAGALLALFDGLELADQPPSEEGKYLLLGEIDFTHPLFAAFANSPYSDFTKIHFWQHRAVKLKPSAQSQVVARFDNGDPALVQRTPGRGQAYLLTSGWQPADSQLAVSSKFVPLWQALLDEAAGGELQSAAVTIGGRVPLPTGSAKQSFTLQKPDGQRVELRATATDFMQTVQPGIYRLSRGSEEFTLAVNLAGSESNTAPLALEQLEQLGVRVGRQVTRAEELQTLRQQKDVELESRQKIWRWLIVAALGVLILETWLAGRTARQIATPVEAVA